MALRFPDGFFWGTATSSHQVEGENRNNQWWAWEQVGGNVKDGTVSGPACDHYNRFQEDFAMMRELGHNAHRLSIEWSRIEPEEGRWDEGEVEHYRRVVDSLHENGLTPFVTLHHFTNPLWFEAKGGWTSAEAPELIARYAGYMAKQLGDAVPFWLTINELSVVPAACFIAGVHPPCERDMGLAMAAARHILIAHGKMYHAIRESAPHDPQIGPVLNMIDVQPASDSEEDRRAAQLFDTYWNEFWLRGLSTGVLGPPAGGGEEAEGLNGTWDVVGLNYYSRSVIAAAGGAMGVRQVQPGPESERSTMGWEVYPDGFYRVMMRLKGYGRPVYITENGIGTDDDEQRQRYIVRHLQRVHQAINEGLDVRSYLHWSFQDNFEWAEGFRQKFGLVEREQGTLNRVPKPSAAMFREIATSNAVSDGLLARLGD
ncbi:MAG: glycoside hydrolase family 1 protein [Dehalococcoidia bacterium]